MIYVLELLRKLHTYGICPQVTSYLYRNVALAVGSAKLKVCCPKNKINL